MKRKLRVGVVGCGRIAEKHLRIYSYLKDRVEVAGVSDLELERAKTMANKFGVGHAFASHRDLLENSNLDVMDICTPTSTHSELAIDAAERGSHVITEKPMARTSVECRRMIDVFQKRELVLCICHNKLFCSAVLAAKQTISKNNWAIDSCSTVSNSPRHDFPNSQWVTDSKEGGFLWEVGAHPLYIEDWFLGEIDSVYAISKRIALPSDDRLYVLLRARSGAVGIIESTVGSKMYAESYHAFIETTTEDRIAVDFVTDSELVRKASSRHGFATALTNDMWHDIVKLYRDRFVYAAAYLSRPHIFYSRTHLTLITKFLDSIESKSPPPVTGEDGLRNILLLEAVQKSIDSGGSAKVGTPE
jgi:predicted dehydrogenase